MQDMMRGLWLSLVTLLAGCAGVPQGLQPVSEFELQPYLGRWYEIARLDHSFERGLTKVSADYRLLPDDRVQVINRGFDPVKQKWREVKGVARFQGARDVGSLEVSFFWPFYAAYNVLVLDEHYRYALVAGPNRRYLWILARGPHLDPSTLDSLVTRAKGWGFATDELVYVDQTSGGR
jgi:apolipoprotein D and lipocalin family protein